VPNAHANDEMCLGVGNILAIQQNLPSRAWIMPEMVRRVVLFPAPLEPIRETISPSLT